MKMLDYFTTAVPHGKDTPESNLDVTKKDMQLSGRI